MNYKGIIFDFDGTLANTTDLILSSFHKSCRDILGHDLPDNLIISTFGLTLKEAMEQLADRPDQVDPMRDIYRTYFYDNHDAMIKALPGVYEAVQELYNKGIAMAVVTSKRHYMATRGLECLGMDKFIKTVIACDDVENPKPAPDGMYLAMKILSLKPEECLCVGDSPFDLQCGHNANIKSVAVTYTLFDWKDILTLGKPDFTINHISDLLTLI